MWRGRKMNKKQQQKEEEERKRRRKSKYLCLRFNYSQRLQEMFTS